MDLIVDALKGGTEAPPFMIQGAFERVGQPVKVGSPCTGSAGWETTTSGSTTVGTSVVVVLEVVVVVVVDVDGSTGGVDVVVVVVVVWTCTGVHPKQMA